MTSVPTCLPELRRIPLDEVSQIDEQPTLHIKFEEDVDKWKTTQSYKDYGIFLRRLCESVVGYELPWVPAEPTPFIIRMVTLLDSLDRWITEIPPLQTPQRFGNLAFRKWGQRLEERSQTLLEDLLGPEYSSVIDFVKPYLLTSFGSFTRMDYGTGHETSFALFLLCLTLVRCFDPIPEIERQLVLVIFLRYLRLCWRLQDAYRLEPAGSHGVWGLDDSHFLPYIFGSAQLRDQANVPVSSILETPLPDMNLYFLSISRIREVKNGPFHEHSSSLHSIAIGVPNWGKVHSGLFKMYEAEVLSKRVVVQHIPLGGLLKWDVQENRVGSEASTHSTSTGVLQPSTAAPAPWAPLSRAGAPNVPLKSFPTRPPNLPASAMLPPASFPTKAGIPRQPDRSLQK